MTLDQNMIHQIERNEAWLDAVMPPDPAAPAERTRFRVRIEVNQAWLEQNATTDPTTTSLEQLKRTLHAECEQLAPTARLGARRGSWWVRRIAGVAAAAVIVWAVGLTLFHPQTRLTDGPATLVRLDDWVDALVLDTQESNDEAADLASLEDRLDSLEASLGENAAESRFGWELDDLGDELEALLTELG
ncbi:MAG: hypothetical protein KAV82_08250 [Phycisphaerae bacterium]|nr:hypothetical protein [Phycisphaerae bacterium]